MIWKILPAQIREEIYDTLISRELFPENRKDVMKDPERQMSSYILIKTSSTGVNRGGKISL